MTTTYVRVATLEQVPPARGRIAFAAGRSFALFNVDGELYALDDACPHAGSSLSGGRLEGAVVTCRAHGLRFDVRTGCMRGVDGFRVASYPVQVAENQISIGIDPAPCPHRTGDTPCIGI